MKSYIFCTATHKDCDEVKKLLKTYCDASGQLINFQKSALFFSKNSSKEIRSRLATRLGIEKVGGDGMYLGLPEVFGRSKRRMFYYIRDRIKSRIGGWKEKLLSQASKEVVLKSVASAIPNHAMSCFLLPKSLCKDISHDMANFWWSSNEKRNKIHWLAWSKLTENKLDGGLGFKDLLCFNKAMLAKQGWRIMMNQSSLLTRILKGRYFRKTEFMQATLGSNPSYGWRSILAGREILNDGICWKIGVDSKVDFWKDPWIPKLAGFRPIPKDLNCQPNLRVGDLIDIEHMSWNDGKIHSLVDARSAGTILGIPISITSRGDRLVWIYCTNGEYSVKSGYRSAKKLERMNTPSSSKASTGDDMEMKKNVIKQIWKIITPPKLKHFLWKCMFNINPVGEALEKKGLHGIEKCSLCGEANESIEHLFFECMATNLVWFGSSLGLRTDTWRGKQTFAQYLESILKLCKDGHNVEFLQALVSHIIWQIWKGRNKVIWEGWRFDPVDVIERAGRNCRDYISVNKLEQANKSINHVTRTSNEGWTCPPTGQLKLNVDAAWNKKTKHAAWGAILRSDRGVFQVGGAGPLGLCSSARIAEAKALREALILCGMWANGELIVESDCKGIVDRLISTACDIEVQGLIEDIKFVGANCNVRLFSFCKRCCNSAAHKFARFGRFLEQPHVWVSSPPSWLEPGSL